MDLFKDVLSQMTDMQKRLERLESANQIQTIIAGGITIIDSNGLNSVGNFPKQQVFVPSAGLSTASTSFIDVSGSSLPSLVLDRDAQVLVYMMSYGCNSDAIDSDLNDNMEVQLYDSYINASRANTITRGATSTRLFVSGGFLNWTTSVADEMVYELAILTFETGTHNLKLQYKAVNGGTAILDAWLAGYIVLGK